MTITIMLMIIMHSNNNMLIILILGLKALAGAASPGDERAVAGIRL